jgi:DNA helicase-2/ATP-dependent DNA helicase PcrA
MPERGRGSSIRDAALAAAAAAPTPGPVLRVGDLVRHRAFGEGIVTACDTTAADVEVTVEFAGGVGIKRLLLSFAPLEKLNENVDSGQGGR